MNIDRHNYEEYFLLYADNELTDSEKAEVLMFVKENKDLEEEFRMIHHTICKPDSNVDLPDKSFLLRGNEKAFINEKNYEEIFVLYHDNELTSQQKKATENFLASHEPLKNEFNLIGLARLVPEDAVVFRHKKKLYRKEKTGKIVPVIFWRTLVAAVFIGCGLWITQLYIQKQATNPGVTVQSIPAKQPTPVIVKKVLPQKKAVDTVARSTSNTSRSVRKEITGERKKPEKSISKESAEKSTLVKTSVEKQQHGQENLTGQPQQETGNENVEKENNEVAIENREIKNIPTEQISENTAIAPAKELVQVNEKIAPVLNVQKASYVADANDNGQNYVFYDITTEEFKKTKLGGFLKKVKRVIARNNPISRLLPGDDRQVVSN